MLSLFRLTGKPLAVILRSRNQSIDTFSPSIYSKYNTSAQLELVPQKYTERKDKRKKTAVTHNQNVHSSSKRQADKSPDPSTRLSPIPSLNSKAKSKKDRPRSPEARNLPLRPNPLETMPKWYVTNNINFKASILITQGDDLLENHILSPALREKTVDFLHYLKCAFPFWHNSLPKNSRHLASTIGCGNPREEFRQFLMKADRFNKEQSAFLKACIDIGEVESVIAFLRDIRQQGRKASALNDGTIFREKRIYDHLILIYHQRNSLSQLQTLFTWMHQDQIVPTPMAYLRFLDCFGKSDCNDVAKLRDLVDKMHFQGLDLMETIRSHQHVIVNDPSLELRHVLVSALICLPQLETSIREMLTTNRSVSPTKEDETAIKLTSSDTREKEDSVKTWAWPVTKEDLEAATERQFHIESEGGLTLTPVVSLASDKRSKKSQARLRHQLMKFRENVKISLLKAFDAHVAELKVRHKELKPTLYPFLKLLRPNEYVDIIMKEFDALVIESNKQHMSAWVVHADLGRKVEEAVLLKMKRESSIVDEMRSAYRIYQSELGNSSMSGRNERSLWLKHSVLHNHLAALEKEIYPWSSALITKIGKCLYDFMNQAIRLHPSQFSMLDESTVIVEKDMKNNKSQNKKEQSKMLPAIYETFVEYPNEVRREVKIEPLLQNLYQECNFFPLHFSAVEMPMLCPPVPWLSNSKSGYFFSSNYATSLLREMDEYEDAQNIVDDLLKENNIDTILDSMNSLGNMAWKVNDKVLDLVLHVFRNKGDKKLSIPPPESECPEAPVITDEMSTQTIYAVNNRVKELRKQRMEMRSLWLSELYRLSIANELRDRVLWFPHSLDFRGRAYPCPPHFNHMGGDVARSLMKFAHGLPLGERGFDWLLIHLVNLTGLKKRSPNDERLKFANEMLTEIIDSAEKPLNGRGWWKNDEDPWQTLACCLEIYAALRHPEGVSKYVSHLPVHQDGSCNGLQHYAAMGRDINGANSVNLTNQSQPQDVYSDVCALVESQRMKDAEGGLPIAKVLQGFIRRKVIKQSVMTTVYGVTHYGAMRQISRQLEDLDDFPQDHVAEASAYLATHTLKCISQIFTSSTEIQDWLSKMAYRTAKDRGCLMEWRTPLGLPVVQPYTQRNFIQFNSPLSDSSSSDSQNHETTSPDKNLPSNVPPVPFSSSIGRQLMWTQTLLRPNATKQRNACPPNFVHSLDATHMMLTAIHCARENITFAAVHDCFWTHASQVDSMNRICREEFINLHSQPILENLSSYITQKFAFSSKEIDEMEAEQEKMKAHAYNELIQSIPPKGQFNLQEVMNSTYFFS